MAIHERESRADVDVLRFRTIFEQSPISTQIFAPDGWTLAVNRAWERLWGVTLEALGEYNVLEDQQLVARGVMPYIRRGFEGESVAIPAIRYEPAQTAIVPGAVPYRWVRAFIYPVRDEEGQITEVVLTHEDITEQVQAEQALRESEIRFRAMFDGAPVGISLLDLEGRYLAVNRARQEMLGRREDELLGKTFREITYAEDLAYDEQVNTEARREGSDHFQLEKRFVRSDGAVRWDRVSVSMVRDENGEPLYSVAITEDITDRKQAEEAQSLLDKQKEEFLSAVAHDVRTPLTGIRGRVQLLAARLQRDGSVEPARLREDLGRIDTATTRISTLMSELLEVANLEIGRRTVLDRRPTDLVSLARQVVEDHRQVASHAITFGSDESSLIGMWDASRIERVLANLLSNASKYSHAGGVIVVRVVRDGDDAELSVSDEGIGIPESDLDQVFDRFQRGRNAVGRIPGSGIGLATVKAIAEEHGGTVSVTSREGQGSTFTVRLPIMPAGV